jgi:hypothetical protein
MVLKKLPAEIDGALGIPPQVVGFGPHIGCGSEH